MLLPAHGLLSRISVSGMALMSFLVGGSLALMFLKSVSAFGLKVVRDLKKDPMLSLGAELFLGRAALSETG